MTWYMSNFLAPLCQVAAELFYCRVVRRPSVRPSRLRGGGGVYFRNTSVTFLPFWHVASLGCHTSYIERYIWLSRSKGKSR